MKGEILGDYHAKNISSAEANAIMTAPQDDRRSDYLFSIPGGQHLDGSSDTCTCHPQSVLLGRLLNYATKGTPACNAVPRYFQVIANKKLFKTVLFVAARDIYFLEEIRFDYGDLNCLTLFM